MFVPMPVVTFVVFLFAIITTLVFLVIAVFMSENPKKSMTPWFYFLFAGCVSILGTFIWFFVELFKGVF